MGRAFSVRELHTAALPQAPRLGLTTAYRAVERWREEGFVEHAGTRDGEAVFVLCGAAGHHHHLVCIAVRRDLDARGLRARARPRGERRRRVRAARPRARGPAGPLWAVRSVRPALAMEQAPRAIVDGLTIAFGERRASRTCRSRSPAAPSSVSSARTAPARRRSCARCSARVRPDGRHGLGRRDDGVRAPARPARLGLPAVGRRRRPPGRLPPGGLAAATVARRARPGANGAGRRRNGAARRPPGRAALRRPAAAGAAGARARAGGRPAAPRRAALGRRRADRDGLLRHPRPPARRGPHRRRLEPRPGVGQRPLRPRLPARRSHRRVRPAGRGARRRPARRRPTAARSSTSAACSCWHPRDTTRTDAPLPHGPSPVHVHAAGPRGSRPHRARVRRPRKLRRPPRPGVHRRRADPRRLPRRRHRLRRRPERAPRRARRRPRDRRAASPC